jgi:hypothetical protein
MCTPSRESLTAVSDPRTAARTSSSFMGDLVFIG